MRAPTAAALATVLLGVGGCGAQSPDEEAASAIADRVVSDPTGGTIGQLLALDQEDADCVGAGLVDKLGTDKLQEYGLLTDDLASAGGLAEATMSAADAGRATKVIVGCSDVATNLADALAASGGVLDSGAEACIQSALSGDALAKVLTLALSGKQDKADQRLTLPLVACAAPQ